MVTWCGFPVRGSNRAGKDATLLSLISVHKLSRCFARTLLGVRAVASLAALAAALLALRAAPVDAQTELPPPDPAAPIAVTAESAHQWWQGQYEVWVLRGNCRVMQDTTIARGDEAVLWVKRSGDLGSREHRVIAYIEGNVAIVAQHDDHDARLEDASWFGDFFSTTAVQIGVGDRQGEPHVKPAVYEHAIERRNTYQSHAVRQAQFQSPGIPTVGPAAVPPGTRRLRAFPLTGTPVNAQWIPNPQRNEWVAAIQPGVNLIIDGLEDFGSIDIAADRMVIWTADTRQPDLPGGQALQSDDTPLEIYMEGNIVFREGRRIIHAQRMYYDVRNRVGTVLQAEVLTPVPDFEGFIRLRAEVVQQTAADRFFAQNAYVTASRLGSPTYRLQASGVYFEDNQTPLIDPFTGAPQIDPASGEPIYESERLVTSYNNVPYFGPVPVFYWPVFATDLREPTFFLRHFRVRNDRIFGTQVLTDWNGYQLLGIRNPPVGTDFDISLDYMDKRGPGAGTTFRYDRFGLFGIPGRYAGFIDAWGIQDDGLDRLGAGRANLPHDKDFRYRVLAHHRQQLPNNLQLTGQLGWISDRNFLEQFYEIEWDTMPDQLTRLELKRLQENTAWSITASTRLNDFFTQTEWLPRFDHYTLGQSLLADWFTWYEHTSLGYGRLRVASPPTTPQELANWEYRPWEVTASGERLISRQEIDLPLQAGPAKIVPFALGELAHWGEAIDGNDLQRAYGQVGVRGSLPIWSVDPTVESGLFNLHGLAHKVTFEAEFSHTESNRNFDELPLYDPLDDDAQEQFRRRFTDFTFGGTIPLEFDERYYAIRSGLPGWVTSPSLEVVDDLTALRFGALQRWQTKRGMPGRRRVIDWLTLDAGAVYFPRPERDNFGEDFGLLNYNFRWHIGDRLTVLSDGLFDFFDDGAQIASVGATLSRPPRGSAFLGFRSIRGPVESDVLTASYSYLMSPKWISTLGTQYDFAGNRNIGQFLTVTRIGESFLISLGFNLDANKDNTGVNLAIEPRFLPQGRLGRAGGARVPPAGLYGLE